MLLVKAAPKGRRVKMVLLVQKELLVLRAPLEHKALKVLKALLVLLVLLVLKAT